MTSVSLKMKAPSWRSGGSPRMCGRWRCGRERGRGGRGEGAGPVFGEKVGESSGGPQATQGGGGVPRDPK